MGWMPLGLIAIWLGAGEKRKRQAHDRHIGPASELKPAQPDATRVAFALDHASGSACAVDEQRAQVTIAAHC